MDPSAEEQLDYGEDDYGGSQQKFPNFSGGGGRIAALADEEIIDGDDYDDLYNDVNVKEGFLNSANLPAKFNSGSDEKAKNENNSRPGNFGNVGFGGSSGNEKKEREFDNSRPGNFGNVGNSGPAVLPAKNVVEPNFGSVVGNVPPGLTSQPVLTSDVVRGGGGGNVDVNGPTVIYVGELQWWTSDAELESVMSQYGKVKEIKFFEERASGKSKGYCQVEFYDAAATAACKEGMNGYLFNGRPCVVTFASSETLKQMGSSYTNRNPAPAQPQQQGRRQMNDGGGRGNGGNYQGGDGGRNFGRGGWNGRGGQGFQNRGQGGVGGMRGRGGMGANKGMGGAAGGMGAGASGVPFAQGLGGPGFGGPAGGLMHPQGMMGAGFDPMYNMGGGGPYGGFSGPAYPGMMPPFQALGAVGLPGVAPHVNPAFFGRGMPANGMSMMGGATMDGRSAGMWSDGGWTGEEHGKKTRESSYGNDDGASDYGYGEGNHERGGRSNASHEKERVSERDWPGNSDRRHRDEREREPEWDRSDRERYKEDKDGYKEYRHKDRDYDYEDNRDRGHSSSRSRSKSGIVQEEDYRSRSRDADYGKRRRLPSE